MNECFSTQSFPSKIYCTGELLHTVQMARLEGYPDSKTFVDMSLKKNESEVLAAFEVLMAPGEPTKEQILAFVEAYFEEGKKDKG